MEMRYRTSAAPLLAASILVLGACAGSDDLVSPTDAASLAKVDASIDLDIAVTQDTIALNDTASAYATGSRAGTGAMSYYATDASVLLVNGKTGELRGTKLGQTRLIGVLQVAGYPVVYRDIVVATVGGTRTPKGSTTNGTTGSIPLPPAITAPAAPALSGVLPELPRQTVDVSVPAQTGRTISVNAGGDLQAAINSARAGDVIALDPNGTWVGNFKLPVRNDAGWVTIRTSTPDGSLPGAGVRLRPGAVGTLPKILTPNAAPAIQTAAGTAGWRFFAVEISATASTTMNYALVGLGDGPPIQTTVASVPNRIVLDRVYVHGTPNLNVRRCVFLNSAMTAIVNSTVTDCHDHDSDAQAIYGFNGPGPFRIENNYLTGSGEVLGFGGPTPAITNLVPADIEIRHNHITRPTSWQGVWMSKNLFELKAGQRVLVEGNVLENNWVDAQNGFAILLQVLSDDNTAPWQKITDITIRNNIVRNTAGGVNLLARVAYGSAILPSTPLSRVLVTNNSIDAGATASLGDNGQAFQLLADLQDVRIERNTVAARTRLLAFDGLPSARLIVQGNLFTKTDYGIAGNSTAEGNGTLAKFAPGAKVTDNVFTGVNAATYPTGNFFPAGGYQGVSSLSAGSYRTAAGVAPGADQAALSAATSGVVLP
jgi:Right handed beta helix region